MFILKKKTHGENDSGSLSEIAFMPSPFSELLEPLCVRVWFYIAWSWENTFM